MRSCRGNHDVFAISDHQVIALFKGLHTLCSFVILTNIKVRIKRKKRGNQAPFNYLRMTKIRVSNTKENRNIKVWSYDNLRQQLSSVWLKNNLETFSSSLGEKVVLIKYPLSKSKSSTQQNC